MTNHHRSYFYDKGVMGDEEFLIRVWPDDAFRARTVSEPKSGTRKDRRTNKDRD